MTTLKMRRGDSFPIIIEITQDDTVLTPDMIADLEVSVGGRLQKKLSEEMVGFDEGEQKWFIIPSQEETLAMDEGVYEVVVRIKYFEESTVEVQGELAGYLYLFDSYSEEVL